MTDFIIVGAGTAGCVLAEALSASGRHDVLLIEAGGEPKSPYVKMPAGFSELFSGPLDWDFETTPQSGAAGRTVFVPRGKMLGGCSNMNVQIHQWCHPQDFRDWVDAGASGWSFDDVEPVFRAQESWSGEVTDSKRGLDGPMRIAPNRHVRDLSQRFVQSARKVLPAGPQEYNGTDYESGAWMCQVAHHRGRRFSAYDAYLLPARRRKNLQILSNTHVLRIDFDGRRATGVTVRQGTSERSIRAAHGVVLAAGAIGSPQLMMLSGIGPAEKLRVLDIPIIREANDVGANLQDHPLMPVVFRTSSKDNYLHAESLSQLIRYLFRGGMLASNVGEAFAFDRTGLSQELAPDLELVFVPVDWRDQGRARAEVDAFGIGVVALAPKSTGCIELVGRDPLAAPRIDFGLLTDADGVDRRVLRRGLERAREIAATAPLAEVGLGERATSSGDIDDDLERYIEASLQTIFHPTSSCRMGSDDGAVVDPTLRVRNVDALWIADASVMPSVPRGHPNAVVAMIAHRAAGWILQSVGR